jgi:hypothetical protein
MLAFGKRVEFLNGAGLETREDVINEFIRESTALSMINAMRRAADESTYINDVFAIDRGDLERTKEFRDRRDGLRVRDKKFTEKKREKKRTTTLVFWEGFVKIAKMVEQVFVDRVSDVLIGPVEILDKEICIIGPVVVPLIALSDGLRSKLSVVDKKVESRFTGLEGGSRDIVGIRNDDLEDISHIIGEKMVFHASNKGIKLSDLRKLLDVLRRKRDRTELGASKGSSGSVNLKELFRSERSTSGLAAEDGMSHGPSSSTRSAVDEGNPSGNSKTWSCHCW